MEVEASSSRQFDEGETSEELNEATGAIESSPRIEQSVLCRDCGYQLMALQADRHCPECGLAIAFSMQRDALGFASTRWLKRTRFGFVVMILGALSYAVYAIGQYIPGVARPSSILMLFIVHSTTLLTIGLGGWLSTKREPNQGASRILNARTLAQIGFGIMMMDSVFDYVRIVFGFSMNWVVSSIVSYTYTVIVVGVAWPAFCIYVSRIARRRPSIAIARQFKVIKVIFVMIAFLTIASRAMVNLLVSPTQPIMNMPYALAAWGSFIGFVLQLTAYIWIAILLVILSVHIRHLLMAHKYSGANPNNSAESATNR